MAAERADDVPRERRLPALRGAEFAGLAEHIRIAGVLFMVRVERHDSSVTDRRRSRKLASCFSPSFAAATSGEAGHAQRRRSRERRDRPVNLCERCTELFRYLLRHVVQEIAEGYAHRVVRGADELALELVEVDQTIAVRLHLVLFLDIGDQFTLLRRAEMRRRRSRAHSHCWMHVPGYAGVR